MGTELKSLPWIRRDNITALCRSCIINPGEINIFKTKFQNLPLNEIIHFCSEEEIIQTEELSNKICAQCLKYLLHSFLFIRRFRDNQTFIHTLYETFNTIPIDNIYLNEIIEKIILNKKLIDKVLKTENCVQCLDKFGTLPNIFHESPNDYHLNEFVKNEEIEQEKESLEVIKLLFDNNEDDISNKFSMEPDDEEFFDPQVKQEETNFSIESIPEETQNNFEEVITIVADESDGEFETNEFVNEETSQSRFQCKVCDKTFDNLRNFRVHIFNHSKKVGKAMCDVCGIEILQRNLKRHLLSHNDHIKMVNDDQEKIKNECLCSICGKTYSTISLLTVHLNKHSDEELKDIAHQCNQCGKFLISEDSLKKHYAMHLINPTVKRVINRQITKKKRYIYGPRQCQICFKKISYLGYQAHMRVHQGLKPYKCNLCPQSFKQQAHLKTHMNIHLDIKPYECKFCKKRFRHLTSIRTHERGHRGEKPFICPICSKGFYESSPMKKHFKIHFKERNTGEVYLTAADFGFKNVGETNLEI